MTTVLPEPHDPIAKIPYVGMPEEEKKEDAKKAKKDKKQQKKDKKAKGEEQKNGESKDGAATTEPKPESKPVDGE